MKIYVIVIAVLAAMPSASNAHGGGLNAEGCHNDNQSDGYHCHRASAAPRATSAPAAAPRSSLSTLSTYYPNCAAARAAGAAPVRRGEIRGMGPIWIAMAIAEQGTGLTQYPELEEVKKPRRSGAYLLKGKGGWVKVGQVDCLYHLIARINYEVGLDRL